MWLGKLKVYVSIDVISKITSECALVHRVETGGILIGYETKNAIVISHATGPGPKAVHKECSLELDLDHISHELRRLETSLPVGYEGNWHSHPGQKQIVMSGLDKNLLRDVVCSPEYDTDKAVMIIVPSCPSLVTDFHAFLLCGCRGRIRKTQILKCSNPPLLRKGGKI
jgi:integrative and conjugative element protein (TIGR02256 family)